MTTEPNTAPPGEAGPATAISTDESGSKDAVVPTARSTEVGRSPSPGALRKMAGFASQFRLVLAYIALVLFFAATVSSTNFVSWDIYRTIIVLATSLTVIGMGLTVVLAVGQFDLSVGSVVSFAGTAGVSMMSLQGMGTATAIGVGLLAGVAGGALSGFLIAYMKIPAFVATLAVGSIAVGMLSWISSNRVLTTGIEESYLNIGNHQIAGLPVAVYIAIALVLVIWYFLDFTVAGRRIRAIGANEDGARLAGIRVARYQLLAFMVFGFCAGLAGILITASNAAAGPVIGEPLLLPAYTGVLLGISATRTGRVHALATVFGVVFMGTLATGLTLLDFPLWCTPVIQGVVLALALFVARGKSVKLF